MNAAIVREYVQFLEEVFDSVNIVQEGVGNISGRPKYHLRDPSAVKVVKALAEDINYDNNPRHYGLTPREKLYQAFNGYGLYSPEEIRKELTDVINAAKNTLSVPAQK